MLIPAKFIGELKGLPEEILSATEAVNEVSTHLWTHGAAAAGSD